MSDLAQAAVVLHQAGYHDLGEAVDRLASERDEMLEALSVIANASERAESMFGGKMFEVTRVFEHITRVSRAATAKAQAQ